MKADIVQDSGNPTGHGRPEDWPKYIADQGWENYTSEDHDVWKALFERQSEIVKGRACQEYLDGIAALEMDQTQIPNFAEASKLLKAKTGWEVVAVDGLIPDLPFFQLLAERKFPAGNFIRKPEQMDYIEEPDVFHDFFGHVPLLANPIFADYMEAYGKGGLKAHQHGTITNLARLYWYTVEFGLIQQEDGMRIYGAGILSSPGETKFAVESDSPNRVALDLKRVMQTNYRVDDFQQTYFVIDSFDQLFKETYADFSKLYEDIKADNTEYAPDDIADGDTVFTRGTQAYANGKK
ncbi:MAG: phenylalanine 4-monooxygenase [Micavibrio sp.]|nr:phenylalanine 4-monooxygenase [Micavibrio sp.]|tara:strand:- start:3398 stop:4279 length:882 start_codon:yes stop_codon:yes gene_type:complete